MPSLKKVNVKDKTVLLRADFDVPLVGAGEGLKVGDDFRMQQALPTIKHLVEHSAKVIIVAHLGRPKEWDRSKSLLPVAGHLANMMGYKFMAIDKSAPRLPHYQMPHVFFFAEDFRQDTVKKMLADLNPKDIAVLENLKFYPGEKDGSQEFAKALAALADLFVSDAFGSSYDGRASLAVVPRYLPHFAGMELEKEVAVLSQILRKPGRPYVLMVGGIKLSDKLEGLKGMMEKIDGAVVGGGLASLFFEALGYNVGKSVIDRECKRGAADLIRNFRDKINLPVDVVVARAQDRPETLRVTTPDKIMPAEMVLDIGPSTIKKFSKILKDAQTIVWSGPMGLFEEESFSHGTKALGWLVSSRGSRTRQVIAGGGNTLDAVRLIKAQDDFDFLSTGGSAMLLFLSGAKMPGIEALKNQN
ncbi:MAG: phosphoglycerate kinase [bacterium]|nr:phosphoglycerate kinase [bacterium]